MHGSCELACALQRVEALCKVCYMCGAQVADVVRQVKSAAGRVRVRGRQVRSLRRAARGCSWMKEIAGSSLGKAWGKYRASQGKADQKKGKHANGS